MCGITAIVSLRGSVPFSLVKKANDVVIHRGPDDEGFYFGENYALGHRRLSIIDLSPAGHQPFERGNLVITYNGEIYNYIELRDELISMGHKFITATDTEVILAAYQQWGTKAFSKFNGMWAFALVDRDRHELILCRDHFGIKPIYIASTKNYFLAASEIKQFTAVDEFECVLNKKIAVNFLTKGWLNYSEETFFQGVSELRPGHYLHYDLVSNEKKTIQWYNLRESIHEIKPNYSEAIETVRDLFNDSLRLRMRSDVPVGSCLSGGIDSSAIVSSIHEKGFANSDFATLTTCFSDRRYDEQLFSDRIARKTGFREIKIYPELDHLLTKGCLDKMIYHQDQPVGGGSHFLEYCVYEAARKHNLIVVQGGQGSDEYLFGYEEFFSKRISQFISEFKWRQLFKFLKCRAEHKGSSPLKELLLYFQSNWLPFLVRLVKSISGRKNYEWLSPRWREYLQSKNLFSKSSTVNDLSLNQMQFSSLLFQLHSEDRNSMMFSIETRLPFLDHRLVEYCMGLPAEFKIKDGYSKSVFRDAMKNILPESVRKRKHKMGFVSPDAEWVIANQDMIRAELEMCLKKTDIFNKELVARFDRFLDEDLDYEPLYFRAMALNKFIDIFKMKTD